MQNRKSNLLAAACRRPSWTGGTGAHTIFCYILIRSENTNSLISDIHEVITEAGGISTPLQNGSIVAYWGSIENVELLYGEILSAVTQIKKLAQERLQDRTQMILVLSCDPGGISIFDRAPVSRALDFASALAQSCAAHGLDLILTHEMFEKVGHRLQARRVGTTRDFGPFYQFSLEIPTQEPPVVHYTTAYDIVAAEGFQQGKIEVRGDYQMIPIEKSEGSLVEYVLT